MKKRIVLRDLLNGKQEKDHKHKPIEFVKVLEGSGRIERATDNPNAWETLVLLEKSYTVNNLDLIWATDNGNDGALFLGHWNDGVTE